MRIPKIENYKNTNRIETIKLPKFDKVSMTVTLFNEKEKVKFIKSIERTVRSSMEYKEYVKFLKEYIDMTKCSFFNNVSNRETKKVSIEIHHEPFTLWDITQTVLEKAITSGDDLNEFKLAEEVMQIHYMGLVGLIPLSITVHELVHNGKIFIPLQNVYGNFVKYVDKYDKFIPQDLKDTLYTKLKMSKDIAVQDLTILQEKYMYLEVDGMTFPHIVSEDLVKTG